MGSRARIAQGQVRAQRTVIVFAPAIVVTVSAPSLVISIVMRAAVFVITVLVLVFVAALLARVVLMHAAESVHDVQHPKAETRAHVITEDAPGEWQLVRDEAKFGETAGRCYTEARRL